MKIKKSWSELFMVFLNQFVSGLALLAVMKILAHFLSPSSYGYYALMSSVVAFVLSFPFNPLNQGLLRKIPENNATKSSFQRLISSIVLLYGVFLFVYLIIFVCARMFFHFDLIWDKALWFIYFYIISQVIFYLVLYLYNGRRKRVHALVLSASSLCISVSLLLVYFIFGFNQDLRVVFLVLAVANLLACFITIGKDLFHAYPFGFTPNLKVMKSIFFFSFPLILMGVFVWMRSMASRWYLDWFVSKEVVAAFAIISSLTIMAPIALQGVLSSYFAPIFYEKEQKQPGYTRLIMRKIVLWLFVVCIITSVITFLLNGQIVWLFSSKHYVQYAWMLAPMYLTFFIYIIASFSALTLFAENKTKLLTVPNITIDVITLTTGFFLAKYYGLNGIFYNSIGSNIVFALMLFYLSFKKRD